MRNILIGLSIAMLTACASAEPPSSSSDEGASESTSSALAKGDTLNQNVRLNDGDYLTAGPRKLFMQHDCNLVLYDDRGAPWSTGTYGQGAGCFAILQGDGNFVVYQPNGHPVWDSGTRAGNRLVLQTDGNIVIYDDNRHVATWATNTVESSLPRCTPAGNCTPPSNMCIDGYCYYNANCPGVAGCTSFP